MLAIADFFHHGNCKRAGGHDIGHGTAGHRSHKSAGHHGRFGGTAGKAPCNGIGKVDEKAARAGFIEECTEQDKYENKGGCHPQGQTEYAFGGEGKGGGDTLDTVALMDDEFRHPGAEITKKQRQTGNDH